MIWVNEILFWMELNLPHPSVIIAASVLAWCAVAYIEHSEWRNDWPDFPA